MLKNYLMMALKVLLRRKFFTFASLFGICFTLVVLMVVTAILDHVMSSYPPETQLDRTLSISRMRLEGDDNVATSNPGWAFLDRYVRDLPHLERLSFFSNTNTLASYKDGDKIELQVRRTDAEYWTILEFDFLEGGPFTADDDASGRPVAVISEHTRERLFGEGPGVGKQVSIDSQSFDIVGVVDDVSFLKEKAFSDVWLPVGTSKTSAYKSQFRGGFNALLLAESRAHFKAIKAELQSRVEQAEIPQPQYFDTLIVGAHDRLEEMSISLFDPEDEQPRANALRAFIVLAMLLFMVLPSLNLINLNLSRAMERSSEIGVRRAFGARANSLLGQFLVENIVLTLIGGFFGLFLSRYVIARLNASDVVPYLDLSLNVRVFFWGLLIALVFGIVSGIYPAWRMSKLHPVEALRGRTR